MEFDFSTLITDRTKEDVSALSALLKKPLDTWTDEETKQFSSGMLKGGYSWTDLNRVTSCMDYLNKRLTALGYVTGYQPIFISHKEPEPVSRLPEGHTELRWITSTGAQHINTGFVPNQDSRMVMDAEMENLTGTISLGGERYSTPSDAFVWISVNGTLRSYFNTSFSVLGPADTSRHIYEKDKNVTKMDGEIVATIQYASFTADFPIYLFSCNENGAASFECSMKLYSCQIYDNGSLARDFVPCTNPDGDVGLYDLVTEEFFGNAGDGVFFAGPELVYLPAGYAQVEYIQSSGTQYVDTEYAPSSKTRVIMDAELLSQASSSGAYFGCRNQNSSTATLAFVFWTMSSGALARSDYFGTAVSAELNMIGNRLLIDKNENVCTVGGTAITNTAATGQAELDMYLLAANNLNDGTPNYFISARLYSCKIYSDGNLIRHYIPSRDPSGVVGLYELVNKEFCVNAGTGLFTAGPDVPTPEFSPATIRDPNVWYEDDTPTASQLEKYLQNVSLLREILPLPDDTVQVPEGMTGLTQEEANTIEVLLTIINDHLVAMQKIFLRSGISWAICGGPNFQFLN